MWILHLPQALSEALLHHRAPLSLVDFLQNHGSSPSVDLRLGVARSVRPLPRRLEAVCQPLSLAALGAMDLLAVP